MTVNYNIIIPDRKGMYNIEMRCSHNGVRMRWNTRIKIPKEWWDKKKQVVKPLESKADESANAQLWYFKSVAQNFIYTDRPITNAAFVEYMNECCFRTEEKNENTNLFDKALDVFLSNIANRTNLNGESITKNRIASYQRIVSDFKRFERKQGTRYVVEDITASVVGKFLDWLRADRNLAQNTLQGRMKMLRTIIATIQKEKGIKTDYAEAKVKGEKVEHIVLTDSEMNAIMEFDTSDNPRLDNVRRLFIVGITTGLRFSDFSTVKPEHISNGVLTIHQQKTGGKVQIPVHPKLAELVENDNMPHNISIQNFNKYLRELALLAGITEPVEVKSVKGGKREVKFVRKCDLMSSHICRRSFATRLYRLGVNPQIIMRLTGHRQLATFMNYIVISDEDVFNAVKNIW